jgi:hypothetical protein
MRGICIQVGCWFRVVIPLVLSQTYLHSKILRAANLLLLRLPLATFQLRKMHKWKKWEEETRQESFDWAKEAMKQEHNLEPGPAFSSTDIKYPKPLREFASFVNMCFGSFFCQFYTSVERIVYLAFCVGFLAVMDKKEFQKHNPSVTMENLDDIDN